MLTFFLLVGLTAVVAEGFYSTPIESGGGIVSTTVDGIEYWAAK